MTPRSRSARVGGGILVTVSILLVVNGAALYLVIVDTHTERTIGLLLAAVGAYALAVAVHGIRHGSAWSWRAGWLLVGVLVALGVHSLQGDRWDVPVLYLGLAVVALVGQLLTGPARAGTVGP